MTIAIIGSRSILNKEMIYSKLDHIFENKKPDLIVSGGAKGPDTLGVLWARDNGISVKEFLPDWNRWGRSAGFKRNSDIVEAADVVIAFWDGVSKGTLDSINKAKKIGKHVKIIKF